MHKAVLNVVAKSSAKAKSVAFHPRVPPKVLPKSTSRGDLPRPGKLVKTQEMASLHQEHFDGHACL